MVAHTWNWLQKNWPHFTYDLDALTYLEYQFLENNGTLIGVLKHVKNDSKDDLLVDILIDEAIKTSEIEGEYLNRDSVQSSIKRNLGLKFENIKVPPAEYGIAEMMVDLYLNSEEPLSHQQLYKWHKMVVNGRRDLTDVGKYRTHQDLMQVISGNLDSPTVHFEAPPSDQVLSEMQHFIKWFNKIHSQKNNLYRFPLTKAGIAHLYFVSIHPFEDGNGRIARAITEKSIALSTKQPTFIALSQMIEKNKKNYYHALELNNKSLEITDWLVYFSKTILDAQKDTLKRIDFLIEKTKFFDTYSQLLNDRQLKVIKKLFEAGYTGFIGGLSADNYMKITKTSASTTTRDLSDLVNKKILLKTGMLKSTRYFLNIKTTL